MKKLKLSDQKELIEYCIHNSKDLHSELSKIGLNYEALVYEENRLDQNLDIQRANKGYRALFSLKKRKKKVPLVSFFTGCGGLDLGFEHAGFESIAMTEINEVFCNTLKKNFSAKIIGPPESLGDVKDTACIIDSLKGHGLREDFEGVFIGGPPCQSFSIAANQRFSKSGKNFKRIGFNHKDFGNLLFDYIYIIKTFRPKAFLIENVEGLLTVDGGDQASEACQILTSMGYNVQVPTILNAADYLVPQNRVRAFIVGVRGGEFIFPKKTDDRIPCGEALKGSVIDLPNSETRNHKAESIQRYMKLRFGKRDKLGRVDRLNPLLPSKTVIAGGTNGGGRSHLHPYIPRTMSVRECARLQTFPDEFIVTGPSARQFTQIGNAVPPVLAYQLAEQIMRALI